MKMNYLLQSRGTENNSKRKFIKVVSSLVIIFLLCLLINTSLGHRAVFFVAKPFLYINKGFTGLFGSVVDNLRTKSAIIEENNNLIKKLGSYNSLVFINQVLEKENEDLKSLLGKKSMKVNTVVASVLSKPPHSMYDSLIIDAGQTDGVVIGDKVLVDGTVFVGEISEVYGNESKVKMYSSPQEKFFVIIGKSGIQAEAEGLGSGNFRVILPKEIGVEVGDSVSIPSITPNVFGLIEKIDSKGNDSFQTLLFKTPINLFELKWVEVVLKNK